MLIPLQCATTSITVYPGCPIHPAEHQRTPEKATEYPEKLHTSFLRNAHCQHLAKWNASSDNLFLLHLSPLAIVYHTLIGTINFVSSVLDTYGYLNWSFITHHAFRFDRQSNRCIGRQTDRYWDLHTVKFRQKWMIGVLGHDYALLG